MSDIQPISADVPQWALDRPKSILQSGWDFLGAPLRMALLPDVTNEKLHLTSLRAERFSVLLPQIKGRLLDVGAGYNELCYLYGRKLKKEGGAPGDVQENCVGVDIFDWGSGCTLIESSADLPFEDNSFDTISFVACINHIPERDDALKEAARVLRPGGRVLITMIGRFIGEVGHRIWWYSEDKHRDVDEEELMGMDPKEVTEMLESNGFDIELHQSFVYGLNHLFVATPRDA